MNKNRCHHLVLHTALLLGGVFFAGANHAAVLQGTGAAPSKTQLGATDAVAYKMVEGGPGHAFIVPYYSVQNGQATVLHLFNSDASNGKAVKLRFRGAGNGDNLLSLYVLLAPNDVWTAVLSVAADGRAQLSTGDSSCTYPKLSPSGQAFGTSRLNATWPTPLQFNATREGYVEAMVAADIPDAAVYGATSNAQSTLFAAIKHADGVLPKRTTAYLDDVFLNDHDTEALASELGFATPSGGLSGSWYLLDPRGTTTFSGVATAFRAVNAAGKSARANYVVFPQNGVGVNQPERFTADPLLASAGVAGRMKDADGNLSNLTTTIAVRALNHDLPDLSTPYYLPASATNARTTAGDLTKMLAAPEVRNQYVTDTSIAARTDWLMSMPMRRYSVGYDYNPAAASARVFSVVPPVSAATASNSQFFDSDNTTVDANALQVCQLYNSNQHFGFSRDGLSPDTPLTAIVTNVPVCGVAHVMSFGSQSTLGASVSQRAMTAAYLNGWATFRYSNVRSSGLPVMGASFMKLTNPSASAGVAANYGLTWQHSLDR
ncbi:MAG: surface layer protein NpdA [Burkholderiales bacterium]